MTKHCYLIKSFAPNIPRFSCSLLWPTFLLVILEPSRWSPPPPEPSSSPPGSLLGASLTRPGCRDPHEPEFRSPRKLPMEFLFRSALCSLPCTSWRTSRTTAQSLIRCRRNKTQFEVVEIFRYHLTLLTTILVGGPLIQDKLTISQLL